VGETGSVAEVLGGPAAGPDCMRTWQSAVTVAMVAMAVTAGCGSSKPSSSPATTGATSIPGSATTVVPNDIALRPDVSIGSCTSVPGGWKARGTAANPGHSAASYLITIRFVTPVGDTVEGQGATTVAVPARVTSAAWAVTAHFHAVTGTQCVKVGVG